VRVVILVLLFTTSVFAQNQPAAVGASCGPKNVTFIVKDDNSQHTLAQPEAGKALVYFIQDIGAAACLGACVTRIGMDGAWVGALRHNSHFSVSVNPGEHHACMRLQSMTAMGDLMAFVHVTAEAGKTYFIRTQTLATGGGTRLQMDPMDSDEAKYLIETLPLSVSHAKK
jgi:hypothetical protein